MIKVKIKELDHDAEAEIFVHSLPRRKDVIICKLHCREIPEWYGTFIVDEIVFIYDENNEYESTSIWVKEE
jgi:hypothetical protein